MRTLIIIFLFWVSLLKFLLLVDTIFLFQFINWLSVSVCYDGNNGGGGKYGGRCSWWKSERIPHGVTIHQTSARHQTHSYGSQQEGKRKSRQIGEAGETVHHVIDGTCHNLCYKHKVSRLNSLLAVFLKKPADEDEEDHLTAGMNSCLHCCISSVFFKYNYI